MNETRSNYTAILAVSLIAHGAAIAAISRRDLPPEDTTIEEIPDRFARLLVPEKPPETREEKKAPEPEKAKPVEKPAEKPKDAAEHKADVQKAVAQKGLIKILGSVGSGEGSALANVLAAGAGFSDDISSALQGASGIALASEGGPSRRGDGAAESTGIGALSTAGGGNVRLREKADTAVRGQVSQEGEAEVDSPTVDKAALARFINLRKGSIQGCYEQQLKRNPMLKGKLVLRFTIGTQGQILEVAIDSDSVGSEEMSACIARLVRAWKLPFSPEADVTVTFPFLFHPG